MGFRVSIFVKFCLHSNNHTSPKRLREHVTVVGPNDADISREKSYFGLDLIRHASHTLRKGCQGNATTVRTAPNISHVHRSHLPTKGNICYIVLLQTSPVVYTVQYCKEFLTIDYTLLKYPPSTVLHNLTTYRDACTVDWHSE